MSIHAVLFGKLQICESQAQCTTLVSLQMILTTHDIAWGSLQKGNVIWPPLDIEVCLLEPFFILFQQ